MADRPELEHGVASLGPPAPGQLPLLVCGVAPLGCCPDFGLGVFPIGINENLIKGEKNENHNINYHYNGL